MVMLALFRDLASKGHRELSAEESAEVWEYLISSLDSESIRPPMRLFDKAMSDFSLWKNRKVESDWRDLIRSSLHEEAVTPEHPIRDLSRSEQTDIERRMVADICKSFETREERVKAWEEQTGKTEKSFYRRHKDVKALGWI